ncbi:MAG: hypothetical protein ABJO36_06805 [Litorimonas sp.]
MTQGIKGTLLRLPLFFAMASLFALPVTALAQSSVNECQKIQDPGLRLECFDALFETKSSDLPTKTEPIASEPEIFETVTITPDIDNFGERQAKDDLTRPIEKPTKSGKIAKAKPTRVTSISQAVTKLDVFGYKKLRITLENGQVWEQVGSVTQRPPKLSSKRPLIAEISEAALSSYFLQFNGKGRAIKVKRVR